MRISAKPLAALLSSISLVIAEVTSPRAVSATVAEYGYFVAPIATDYDPCLWRPALPMPQNRTTKRKRRPAAAPGATVLIFPLPSFGEKAARFLKRCICPSPRAAVIELSARRAQMQRPNPQ